jgi:hypothetical protein
MLFSPSLALWMIARPVASSSITFTRSTPTPPSDRNALIHCPSVPTAPSKSTLPPALATA